MAAEQILLNCMEGRVEEVRKALEAGADPNTAGGYSNRTTYLMVAARFNHDQVVGLLLSSPGIQINAKDNFGLSGLIWMIWVISDN